MRIRALFIFGAFLAACGGPSSQGVKSTDELMEERYGHVDGDDDDDDTGVGEDEATDHEKQQEFNLEKSKNAIKQAQRSAEDCVGVVTEDGPRGIALVHITFANSGNVKEATIDPPFEDTAIGKCVLNAMGNIVVPPYTGPEISVPWEIKLEGESSEKEEE